MIFHYDFRYTLVKIPVKIALRLNFTRLVITGKKSIPKNDPVIFAPNHRNALIDALLLVYTSWHTKQIVFLARADIFKKKFVAWILRGARIIPIFRLRDGKDNLEKNAEIFDVCGRILKKNNPIALFPEARHNPKLTLLPIQKAVPRIVLPTEAQMDFSLNTRIVPVGIYYTDVFHFLSDCFVTFGKPLFINDYKEIYEQNPNFAINQLRADLEQRLQELVVNIRNDDYYEEYKNCIDWNVRKIAQEKFSGARDAVLQATMLIIKHLDDLFENNKVKFNQKIEDFQTAARLLKAHGLKTKDPILAPSSKEGIFVRYGLLFLFSPIAVWGFLNNIFPLLIYRKLCTLFKDKQFIPSVRYVCGLFFVPLFSVLQAIAIQIVSGNIVFSLSYFLTVPVTFLFAIHWRKWLQSVNSQWRVNRFQKYHYELWKKMVSYITLNNLA